MDQNIEWLLLKLEDKLNQQTSLISTNVTNNIMQAFDEKMKTLLEENNNLKTRITKLEQKIEFMEKDKRKNNLVFFGIEEKEKTEFELVECMKKIIEEMGIQLESQEIAKIYRIGQRSNKNRPIVVSFTTTWKKNLIQKNKSNLPKDIYLTEDYPKEVLETRKKLKPIVEEERKKGNFAYIKYDKIVVKNLKDSNREKRKRDNAESPETSPTNTKKKTD
ncbi:unnamed protein product [Euphydryas editha]|uniref:Endonuclease-reverse transcriptase n=1 Tax=Euphydryas editha TaxID=104508 RepID=A0AAU9TDG5_EUPED|nr:unnamed protein product [Euphydryas editha]